MRDSTAKIATPETTSTARASRGSSHTATTPFKPMTRPAIASAATNGFRLGAIRLVTGVAACRFSQFIPIGNMT